jgi:hypothetical protein
VGPFLTRSPSPRVFSESSEGFLLHWLHEHVVPYAMAALVTKVSPEHPDVLRKKFEAKFAEDVLNKRVLYGLQVVA